MRPKYSFWNWFSKKGRLQNKWYRALQESNLEKRIQHLLWIMMRLTEEPLIFVHLWDDFLECFLDPNHITLMRDEDLALVWKAGQRLADEPSLSLPPEILWFRLVKAYDDREERLKAAAVLRDIYWAPSSKTEVKARCCELLVQHKARGDQDILVYVDYLSSQKDYRGEISILDFLSTLVQVDFSSDPVLVKRAGQIAETLAHYKIVIPEIDATLGLYYLRVIKDNDKSITHFEKAIKQDSKNRIATIGLISAWIKKGEYEKVIQFRIHKELISDQTVHQLLDLSKTLYWLDNLSLPESPPLTAVELEKADLEKYVGEAMHIALGRLHLIEGSIAKAKRVLSDLVKVRPTQYRWRYYATWAAMLNGDQDEVVEQFKGLRDWPGSWAVACLLHDFDPKLAKKLDAQQKFDLGSEKYRSVISARISMMEFAPPSSIKSKHGKGEPEEELERFRTELGLYFYQQDKEAMAKALESPTLKRLPLPDQLMWKGLCALLHGDRMIAKTHLEKATFLYRYSRAALILCLCYLKDGQIEKARPLFDTFLSQRNDYKVELLKAYFLAAQGKMNSAIEKYENLLHQNNDDTRIHYGLANVYLVQGWTALQREEKERVRLFLESAATGFEKALQNPEKSTFPDAQIRGWCCRFIISPDSTINRLNELLKTLENLPLYYHDLWLSWFVTVAGLIKHSGSQTSQLGQKVMRMLEDAEQLTDDVCITLALILGRACIFAKHQNDVKELIQVIEFLSSRSGHATIRKSLRLARTWLSYLETSGSTKRNAQNIGENLYRLVQGDPGNIAMVMLGIYWCLKQNENNIALDFLHHAKPEDDLERSICLAIEYILGGRNDSRLSLENVHEALRKEYLQAAYLLQATVEFSQGENEKGLNTLMTLINEEPTIDLSILSPTKFLPLLCNLSLRKKQIPEALKEWINAVGETSLDTDQSMIIARCAAAIDEADVACKLWERVIGQNQGIEESVRQEYVKYLSYLAISAYQNRDFFQAINWFRRAASNA
ncbi:MAG: hypothetical protein D6732_25890 [Methanobacteriota archaeon]|nr:MAG: hypothetical protein D6732_25890 [Euryarchaeota archaeon]